MGRPVKTEAANHGQALLLAILIMMAILLTGTLFVAVVNYSQRSSTRHSDMVKAMNLAEAGIRYANYMLQFSAEGLDWRPPAPPYQFSDDSSSSYFWGLDGVQYTDDDYYAAQEIDNKWSALINVGDDSTAATDDDYFVRFGFTRYPPPANVETVDSPDIQGGHYLLRVTYDPDPPYEKGDLHEPDPRSKHIKIESIGVVDDEGFVFRRLEAYKPVVLTDYLLFVSDKTQRGYPTILGFDPYIDMDKDDSLDFFSPEFAGSVKTYTWNGPMRFNTDVEFIGANNDAVDRTNPESASNKILLVKGDNNDDDDITDVGEAAIAPIIGQDYSIALGGGYLRDDYFQAWGQVTDELYKSTGSEICAAFDVLTPTGPSPNLEDLNSKRVKEDALWLTAPELFAQDPATGTMRWDALTRDAGVVVECVDPARPLWHGRVLNVAQLGYMWDKNEDQIAGLYIDNFFDLQFSPGSDNKTNPTDPARQCDINKLIQDWLHNLPPTTHDSGWQDETSVGEVYGDAPAVEIELYPTEADTVLNPGDASGADWKINKDSSLQTDALDLDEIWWPNHVGGEPGIRVTRGQWSDSDHTGSFDGKDGGAGDGEWVIGDPNQPSHIGEKVDRTMYVDYPQGDHAVIYAEGNIRIKGRLPRRNVNAGAPNNNSRQYHLTVVSGGTIYIDGQILSPQDQYDRDVDGSTDPLTGPVPDEYNSYIALLARDCVVVNPTMLVPQFTDKHGTVTAQNDPDDPLGMHWQMPPSQVGAENYAQSSFYFGHTATTATDHTIQLVVRQTLDTTGVTTLTRPLNPGDTEVYVEDATGFMIPPLPMGSTISVTHAGSGPETAQNLGTYTIAGNVITLDIAVPVGSDIYVVGDFVENPLSLDVTGFNLEVYNPLIANANERWQYYDFDGDPGTVDEDNIFLLTRKNLTPDEPWFWEMNSLWCPLQYFNPLDVNDQWWPWTLFDATTDYIDMSDAGYYPGVANYVRFKMPAADDITAPAANDGGTARNYWLKKFKILELDSTGQPVGAVHAKINAVMYAENGCFFVIPCRYFHLASEETWWESEKYLRYNYDIEIRGAITENFHPGPAAVREWQEKWAYPLGGTSTDWNSIRYIYDETLLAARLQAPTTLTGNLRQAPDDFTDNYLKAANRVKLPLLPATPDLLYYGEPQ